MHHRIQGYVLFLLLYAEDEKIFVYNMSGLDCKYLSLDCCNHVWIIKKVYIEKKLKLSSYNKFSAKYIVWKCIAYDIKTIKSLILFYSLKVNAFYFVMAIIMCSLQQLVMHTASKTHSWNGSNLMRSDKFLCDDSKLCNEAQELANFTSKWIPLLQNLLYPNVIWIDKVFKTRKTNASPQNIPILHTFVILASRAYHKRHWHHNM